jgi:hypothetical protein
MAGHGLVYTRHRYPPNTDFKTGDFQTGDFQTGRDAPPGSPSDEGMLMSSWIHSYRYLPVALALLLLFLPRSSAAAPTALQDSISVPAVVNTVEQIPLDIAAFGLPADSSSNRRLWLSQTNDAPFLTGPASVDSALNPILILSGTPTRAQSGTYTINWSMRNDSIPPFSTSATTSVIVHRLSPPTGIQAYYRDLPSSVPIRNSTGILNFVVWDGTVPEADPFAWKGYRVRRTIHGISPMPFEVAGQFLQEMVTVIDETNITIRTPTSPLCLAETVPCVPDSFQFTGTGLFFRGFRNNRLANGQYVIDYPPGAPVDECSSCWVFADVAAMAGFRTDYTVTSIGPGLQSDLLETPLSESAVVTVSPGAPPAANLERVAVVPNPYKHFAEWDPAAGEGRVHFIHLPVGSRVRIFTTSAELVRELTLNAQGSPGGVTGELEWDLRNGQGKKVVSGIYVYQVETPEGRARKGHFVIIK